MPSVLDLIQRLLRKCCNAIEASGLSSLLDATCRVCDVYLRSSNEVRHRDANAALAVVAAPTAAQRQYVTVLPCGWYGGRCCRELRATANGVACCNRRVTLNPPCVNCVASTTLPWGGRAPSQTPVTGASQAKSCCIRMGRTRLWVVVSLDVWAV